MENMLFRIENLEKQVEEIHKLLRKKAEERKLKLNEKFSIHDRAQNLKREFEAMRIEDSPFWEDKDLQYKISELKTIIKYLVELVDYALGKDF